MDVVPTTPGRKATLEPLSSAHSLIVSQKKEWAEILLGFETRNRYVVFDQQGQELFLAAEVAGSFLARLFLGSARPFTMHILTPDQQPLLVIEKPFRFFFYRFNVFNASHKFFGTIQARFSIVRRVYSVWDSSDKEIFRIIGPFWHPWTFQVQQGNGTMGQIVKKWSGTFKEVFTDTDNFGVDFPVEFDVVKKALLLAAVFLIDFAHFENGHAHPADALDVVDLLTQ